MADATQAQGWHVGQWGTLGWLETIAKIVGIIAAFIAFFQAITAPDFRLGGSTELDAVTLTLLLTLVWTGVLITRFRQREIIAMIFGIFNALAHAALLIALLKPPVAIGLPIVFAIAYIVGELIKRVFLVQTGYTEGGRSASAMLMVSNVFIGVYVALLVFLLI
jgi:hypothetical protein